MKLHIRPTADLQGRVRIPGSKSQSIRGLLFALMAKGESRLSNILEAKDTEAAMNVLRAFGAECERDGDEVVVKSSGPPFAMSGPVHSGNSGITTRFMLPLAGLTGSEVQWDVDEQMRARPMQPLFDALSQLGMEFSEGWPLRARGQLQGGECTVDGQSSQYLSALLMSLPLVPQDSIVHVHNLQERPYVDMSLAWLDEQNIPYEHSQEGDRESFHVTGNQSYAPIQKNIPGDWSSASYFLAAGALLPGEVHLSGLNVETHQGDKAVLDILQSMGADIQVDKGEVLIRGGQALRGRTIDCSQIPDMLPTLAVIATQAEGETKLINCAHARIKETDRIQSMFEGLKAMGADIEAHEDGLTIRSSQLQGATLNGYEDHRTIMALALAGLLAQGESVIETAEGISKTFPSFVKLMRSLGARMHMSPLVLMGFKHTGKSSVGRALAQSLAQDFLDLDDLIESMHAESSGQNQSCREIVAAKGEPYFRQLETKALARALHSHTGVLALGGGTPLQAANQALLQLPTCIQLIAPKQRVFGWIKAKGRPSTYGDGDFFEEFSKRWDAHQPIYASLADFTIHTDRPAAQSSRDILEKL